MIVDNIGNRSAGECRRSLTPTGRCVMVGGPKQSAWIGPFGHLLAGKLGFAFRSQQFRWFMATETADDLTAIWAFVERGQLRPVIDRRVGLDEVADAMRDLATGHTRGKIVVVP